VIIRVNLW